MPLVIPVPLSSRPGDGKSMYIKAASWALLGKSEAAFLGL